MDLNEQARHLYEDDGLTLMEIADKLNINPNTVRSWKRRQMWETQNVAQIKGHNPKSLANLEKHENFGYGNRAAVTHGLYADNSNQPGYDEYYRRALEEPISVTSKEVFAGLAANCMLSMQTIDLSDFKQVEIAARACYRVCCVGYKVLSIELTELKIEEKSKALRPDKIVKFVVDDDDKPLIIFEDAA